MPAWPHCRAQLLRARGRADHASADGKFQGAAQSRRSCGSPGPGPQARSSPASRPCQWPGTRAAAWGLRGRAKAAPPALDSSDSEAASGRRTPGGPGRPVCKWPLRLGVCQCSRVRVQCDLGRAEPQPEAGSWHVHMPVAAEAPGSATPQLQARYGHDPHHDAVMDVVPHYAGCCHDEPQDRVHHQDTGILVDT